MLSTQRHVFRFLRRCCLYCNTLRYSNIDSTQHNYEFAPDTIDVISHANLDFINPKQRKKIDKMEDKISIFLESGFQVYEYDDAIMHNVSRLFQVGHHDQYKQFATANIFKLFDTFMYPKSHQNQWTIPKSMKNELGIRNMKSVIDFHPFNSNNKYNNWKQVPNEKYAHLMDNFGVNMPLLTMSKGQQELLIWRDIHDVISNMHRINTIMNQYNPDIIILEGCCDESTMKVYTKPSYNMYLKISKTISGLSRIYNRQNQERIGRFMFHLADILCVRVGEIQKRSFVAHGIIKHLMDNTDNTEKQPLLVFGDLTLDICAVLMVFAEYLDTFQLPMLLQLLSDDDDSCYENSKNNVNFEEIYRKLLSLDLEQYGVLTEILYEFLSPHRKVVASYRNQFLCLAINEAVLHYTEQYGKKCKILAVMGQGHVNDVIYKLQNINTTFINPFKQIMDNKQVPLKSNISIPTSTLNSFNNVKLNDLEKEFVVREFGNKLLYVLENKLQEENNMTLMTNVE